MNRYTRRIIGGLIALLMLAGIGTAAASSASAVQSRAIYGSYLYNAGPGGIGVVTDWGSARGTYNYVLGSGQWSGFNVKGVYVGKGYCTDVYYDNLNGWVYRFTHRGGQYGSQASFAIQITDRVKVYSYFCGW
jgi:hypothetical protein